MIETLKDEYVEVIASSGLLDQLIGYFVMVSGQSTIPFDDKLLSVEIKDMQVDQLRYNITNRRKLNYHTRISIDWQNSKIMVRNRCMQYDNQ